MVPITLDTVIPLTSDTVSDSSGIESHRCLVADLAQRLQLAAVAILCDHVLITI